METTGEIIACDGNMAAAYGALLCRPDVIAAYPITPQTPVVEALARFVADGVLDSEMVAVEGENSAMGVVSGASAAGARVFTATSGQGLYFMFDACLFAARVGLPIVMANVCRDDLPGLAAGEQDIMGLLDTGWVHIHVENNQEILDSIIMAYKLAEDPDILLPVVVCYDGWYLSYQTERVEIPPKKAVLKFVPPLQHARHRLDPDQPTAFNIMFSPREHAEVRFRHLASMERVKDKIDKIDGEFKRTFGRSYGGQVEEYRTEDAEILLVALGSCAGTAKVAVDNKRSQGIRAGLLKVRLFRPFPKEKVCQIAQGKRAIGVLDRSVCFGWNCGHLFMETRAALWNSKADAALINFIDGLGGADITLEHIERAIDMTYQASQGQAIKEVTWLTLE